MFLIGKGKAARETYPQSGGIANSALVALLNRYLVGSTTTTPDAFTTASPTAHYVAAVNVVRKASGLFVVMAELPATLAAPDTMAFAAFLFSGATASGGTASGAWLVGTGSPIVPSAISPDQIMAPWEETCGAGNLTKTPIMVGINPMPAPAGASVIVIAANTIGGTTVTPGSFSAAAFELP
jgi:hypothetical protein